MEKVTFRVLSKHQDVLFQLMGIMNGKGDKTKTLLFFKRG